MPPMSLLSRESTQPLTEQLAQRFVTRMRDQLWVSGARLPSVRQCAQMHGVSASTVVAAYDWLVAQGWVEARPNRGFFVRDRVQRTPSSPVAAGGVVPSPPPVNAASLIRGMFHQPSAEPQPGMGVFPADWLDADFLSAALRKVVTSPALRESSLRYGEPQGDTGLREALSSKLASMGLHAAPDQLITTVGATHALDIISRTLLRPGDCVMVEEPGWAIEFARLQNLGVRILPVPRLETGPDLEVVERYAQLHAPKMMVSVSVLHNPTGYGLSLPCAHQLVNLAHRYNFHVVEDDTYGHMAPAHAVRLSVLDGLQKTIYVSGYAKILAPSWRVGYMAAPADLKDAFLDTKLLSTLTTPVLFEKALALCLEQGAIRRHTERLSQLLEAARSRSVKLALAHGCQFVAPPQGLFGWVDVGVDTDVLALRMHDAGYLLAPGSLFHADRRPGSFMRVNFASTQDEKFWRALAKTRQALL
ncbi:GntR family transcriptional regulator [Limnohabitans planktonicus II-D5]|uniref:GntR family transcriptional regulator n=1 Tax=Limnohabitans planktonicus II-D5 TaxID=1293045 RepID=A0A2T7UDW3_9BURK|nr:GntR family transcriptional regulator [Limnohabitans planktonicus II-D5]|eukprot:gene25457-30737_t